MKRLKPLWLALALLTTLPVGRCIRAPVTPLDQGRSVACYPLVGLLIGALLALLAMVLQPVPALLGAALLLLAWVAITGALHLDGLADCSDALAAGHADPTRILAVMKDPACGPVAVTVLVLALLLKLGALVALMAAPGKMMIGVLVAAPMLARCAAVLLMLGTQYRRSRGIAVAQSQQKPVAASLAVVVLLALAGFLVMPALPWLLLLLASGLVLLIWRRLWQRGIGGYTGDTVGGLIECVELAVLIFAVLMP